MNQNQEAKALFTAAGIAPGQEFDSLSAAQMTTIKAEAAVAYERKHGKPMPAAAETLRGFVRKRYDLLQQRARS